MNARHAPLRDRLRAIDADQAERQTQLIAALNARAVADGTLSTRLAFERDRHAAGAWIRFRAGAAPVMLAPLLVDGELVRLSLGSSGPDPAAAAALLERIEPLVVAIESALGEDLYPDGLDTTPPTDAILLRVDLSSARGAVRHRLLAALPVSGQVAAPQLPASTPSILSALRSRWRAILDGPPLPVSRFGSIGVGDLLLLGIRPLVARTHFHGRSTAFAGRVDLSQGTITLQDDVVQQPDPHGAPGGAAPAEGIDWETLKVATTIEIDGGLIAASDVAGLAAGSVLPLPGGGATLAVRVVAGGTPIGSGELVAIGDGFGVLFTSVATSDGALPAQG